MCMLTCDLPASRTAAGLLLLICFCSSLFSCLSASHACLFCLTVRCTLASCARTSASATHHPFASTAGVAPHHGFQAVQAILWPMLTCKWVPSCCLRAPWASCNSKLHAAPGADSLILSYSPSWAYACCSSNSCCLLLADADAGLGTGKAFARLPGRGFCLMTALPMRCEFPDRGAAPLCGLLPMLWKNCDVLVFGEALLAGE